MVLKKDYEDLVVRVDECLNGKGGVITRLQSIDNHLLTLNDKVSTTITKLAKTDAIAKEAKEIAEEAHREAVENPKENRRYIDKLFITALGSMLTAIAALIIVIIEIATKQPPA